jgi:hypothetical protein
MKIDECYFFLFSIELTCGRLPLAKDPGHHGGGCSCAMTLLGEKEKELW